jgi:RNA polymerase sigma-70 factor (ECF subfamily)
LNARVARVLPLPSGAASTTDAELVARGVAGERFALQLLYRRHVAPVAACITRLLARSAEAEDVVQDAFLSAFRDLRHLGDPARFAPWLMRIAVHQAHRRFRRRRLLARFGLDRGVDDARLAMVVDPGAAPDVCAELAHIDRALEALPAALRLAWMLRHVEGCALEELAEHCGCSLATAKRRIQRAELAVGAALGEHADEQCGGGDHG